MLNLAFSSFVTLARTHWSSFSFRAAASLSSTARVSEVSLDDTSSVVADCFLLACEVHLTTTHVFRHKTKTHQN